ncbi:MAG: DNA/RNA nuclease SfsA [Gammaproteobacteria bacterium]|nr:DNA/RNA nuclease SfsA [Gammaproteobacteria bacterium]
MNYPGPLEQAVLLRRYKRFLADVETPAGEVLTIHCPNTGSMRNCREPGSRVWYTTSDNPKRKYRQTWQIVEVDGRNLVGVNTAMANPLVEEAIKGGLVQSLAGFTALKREAAYSSGGRADFLVSLPERDCYVEVKNVSLAEEGVGRFPDAVTERGQRHLRELMAVRRDGFRAMVIFCVAHDGAQRVRPADDIDPRFGELLREAAREGVELLACGASYDIAGGTVLLDRQVPVSM